MPNFYGNSGGSSSGSSLVDTSGFFDGLTTGCIDLRAELTKILHEEGRGTTVVYRKVQMDDRGFPVKCACWDCLTQEPDIDTQCRNCRGVGYVFNDHMVRGYRSQSQGFSNTRRHEDHGVKQTEFRTFYFEFDVLSSQTLSDLDVPTRFDKIIEVTADVNGNILSPLNQSVKYDIISVDPYRLEEGGRLEYYRVRARANLEGSFLI